MLVDDLMSGRVPPSLCLGHPRRELAILRSGDPDAGLQFVWLDRDVPPGVESIDLSALESDSWIARYEGPYRQIP